MADISVNVKTVQGQGEEVSVHEVHVSPDTVILDPNAENAVQVPEGVGADSTGAGTALGNSYIGAKTVEEQFAEADKKTKK